MCLFTLTWFSFGDFLVTIIYFMVDLRINSVFAI